METLIRALSNHKPGKYMEEYMIKRAKLRSGRKKRLSEKKTYVLKTVEKCGPDEDYGEVDILSEEELEVRKKRLEEILRKQDDDILKIERDTRGQSSNPLWKQERAYRLTASNFGTICKRRSSTPPDKLVKNLLYNNFQGNKSTRWGQEHEIIAIQEFTNITGLEVKSCGLFIGKGDEYFLGASPDGILTQEDALVEVKCPEKLANISMEEAVDKKKIDFLTRTEDNLIKLKKQHNYYYQVQGQLHITGKKFCYFFVWGPIGKPHIEKIEVSHEFWKENMLPKLREFYFKNVVTEIIKQPI